MIFFGDLLMLTLDIWATTFAASGPAPLPLACALADLDLVGMIEHLGQEELKRPQELADAFVQILRARAECEAGRIDDAMAIYLWVEANLEIGLR